MILKSFKVGCLLLGVLMGVALLQGQDRKKLEKKRIETEKEIELTKKILLQTGKQKNESLSALSAVKNLIKVRERLIFNLNKQIQTLNNDIQIEQEALVQLQIQLAKEKQHYAKYVVYHYKSRQSYNEFTFLFSATDLFNAYNRAKYLKIIANEQNKLIERIEKKQQDINLKIQHLQQLKEHNERLLRERLDERSNLEADKSQKNQILLNLTGKEKELKEKLKKQQESFQELNRQINLAIAKELEEARKKREAEKKKDAQPSTQTLTPEAQALSDDFEKNKNKLPWPVERGFISQYFGTTAHPTLQHISIENNGIDIATEQGAIARCIFRGEVSAIFPVPGMGKAVLINHGMYYTVYARLESVTVTPGQTVQLKQPIGNILTDENAKTELHFEIWKNQEKLNPQHWIIPLR
jgi:septal ring factor EnvC (AmiA/AmiB activator)